MTQKAIEISIKPTRVWCFIYFFALSILFAFFISFNLFATVVAICRQFQDKATSGNKERSLLQDTIAAQRTTSQNSRMKGKARGRGRAATGSSRFATILIFNFSTFVTVTRQHCDRERRSEIERFHLAFDNLFQYRSLLGLQLAKFACRSFLCNKTAMKSLPSLSEWCKRHDDEC